MLDNKQSAKVIKNEIKCICRAIKEGCNSPKCANCDLVMEDNDIIDGMTNALRCLEAEDKIVKELNALSYIGKHGYSVIDTDMAVTIVRRILRGEIKASDVQCST